MPRPGPRPYECVKRAWHSERHQPMRGLIIQHIFRLVRDNHSDATKKNREWQEKLPIVVFKAEEIMYSKANSEAEYSNLETVWDRANDAVDTIIRRDESAETGDLLPPCVEAALNLGCVPVKATRSEMLNNPRTYLRPKQQDNRETSPRGLNENSNVPLTTSSNSPRANVPRLADSPRLFWESNNSVSTLNTPPVISPAHIYGSFSSTASAYPRCYGTTSLGFEAQNPEPNIIVGVPVLKSVPEPAKAFSLQDLFPGQSSAREAHEEYRVDKKSKGLEATCDLSLRLGVATDVYSNSSSREKDNPAAADFHRPREEFCFFPVESDALGQSSSSKSRFETESECELARKKRKQPENVDSEIDHCVMWLQGPISNQFASLRSRRPES